MVENRQAYLVTFGFDQALRAMKVGFRVKRIEGGAHSYKLIDGFITYLASGRELAAKDTRYPVTSFSVEDILAYDWVVVLDDGGKDVCLTGVSLKPVEPWDELEPIDRGDTGG